MGIRCWGGGGDKDRAAGILVREIALCNDCGGFTGCGTMVVVGK